MRQVIERGLSALIARWLLDGGAEAVFSRIENAKALRPEELAQLRADTEQRLRAVHQEGQAYLETATGVLQGLSAIVPDLQGLMRIAGSTVATVAARSAESAAAHAQSLADRLAQAQERAQAEEMSRAHAQACPNSAAVAANGPQTPETAAQVDADVQAKAAGGVP